MPQTSPSPRPTFCLGCGRDHRAGGGCGYDRQVRWTKYGRQEHLAHARFFPVFAGFAAGALAVYFVLNPPAELHFLYIGVGLPALIAVLFGGFGTKALIDELRKKRFRVDSTDGRDRGLVVFVGDELRYAFGESLKYEPVEELDYVFPLSSAAALALGDELAELMDPDLVAWVRRESGDDSLLEDVGEPDTRLALVVAMTVLGLLGRGQIALWVGSYQAFGRGGGKLPKTTTGAEVALDALTAPTESAAAGIPPLETEVLALCPLNAESPTALDSLVDAMAAGRDAATWLDALARADADAAPDTGDEGRRTVVDLEAARAAFRRVQAEQGELVMRLLQHVLPGRPCTIGGEAAPEA